MSEGDKGISYKKEKHDQDFSIYAPPYAIKNRLHSQAHVVGTSDRLVASTRTISLPSRYFHGAWTYHNRLLGTPGRMRDRPGVWAILAARTEGGRETRSETVRPQESGLWLSKVPQKLLTRAILSIPDEHGCRYR